MLDELKQLNRLISGLLQIQDRNNQGSRLARQEKSFIDTILDASGALVVVYDEETRFICFNRACEEATGFTFREVNRRFPWEDLIPEEEVSGFKRTLSGIHSESPFLKAEFPWKHKDGKARFIVWEFTALTDGDGSKGYIVGIGIDITGLRKTEKALRESEERYRTLAESAQDYIFIINREMSVNYVNAYAAAFTGFRQSDIKGKPLREIFPPQVAETMVRGLKETFEKGEGLTFVDHFDMPGKTWSLSTRLIPLKNQNGEINEVMGISREIT